MSDKDPRVMKAERELTESAMRFAAEVGTNINCGAFAALKRSARNYANALAKAKR